jgi:hypothetical protein
VTAWATELEFAYDHGHLYVLDAGRHWSEAEVDVRMPRSANFFVPLRVEGWGGRPPLDLDGWDHVVEFSLPVPSGRLALASGGIDEVTVGIAPGAYRARWSGRNLSAAASWERDDNAPDAYRLQLWPGPATAPKAEIKRWAGVAPRGELGDLPALLADEQLDAIGTLAGFERTADGLRVHVRLAGTGGRSWDRAIRADGVVRWIASSTPFDRAALHGDHPGLLPYADDRGALSFRGTAEDVERLAHALRAAHAQAAGPHIAFEDVVNTIFAGRLELLLSLGFGQLANGPVTLLRRYAEVASEHGVETSLIVTGPGRNGLCLLELGESFVVAERFTT